MKPNVKSLTLLLEAIGEASEPSTVLDEFILRVLGFSEPSPGSISPYWRLSGRCVYHSNVTASIDAALELLQATLPGWLYRVASCSVSDDAWCFPDFNHPKYGSDFKRLYPEKARKDPPTWFGTDVDRRPPGNEALALCTSIVLGKLRELQTLNFNSNRSISK